MSYKIIFLTIITAFLSINLNAQEIVIKSINEVPTDLDARVNFPVRDNNGRPCALIKIATTLPSDEFRFEFGSSIGVWKTEQKKGEIWVYVSAGATRISIFHETLKAHQNYSFGTGPLKEATVYSMNIEANVVKEVITRDVVNVGYFIVSCDVEGAFLQIDNGIKEMFVNGRISKTLPAGSYSFSVTEDVWYKPEYGRIVIKAGASERQTITLTPKYAALTVRSEPSDAIIVLDGVRQTGRTPFTIEKVLEGERTIVLHKEMYKSTTQNVNLVVGLNNQATINLTPNYATITIVSPQEGATIVVNNERKGTTRWTGNLTEGTHIIEVQKESHRSRTQTITVTAGRNETVNLPEMQAIFGTLNINVTNTDAEIFIDGVKQNQLAPAIIRNILVGKRTIRLTATGYNDYTTTVDIEEGKIAEITTSLNIAPKVIVEKDKSVNVTPATVEKKKEKQKTNKYHNKRNFYITTHVGSATPIGKFGGTDPEKFLPDRILVGAGSQGGAIKGVNYGLKLNIPVEEDNFYFSFNFNYTFNSIDLKIYDYYSINNINGNDIKIEEGFKYQNFNFIIFGLNYIVDFNRFMGLYFESGLGFNVFSMSDLKYSDGTSTSFNFAKYDTDYSVRRRDEDNSVNTTLTFEVGGGFIFFNRRLNIGAYYTNSDKQAVTIKDQKTYRPVNLKVEMFTIRVGLSFAKW